MILKGATNFLLLLMQDESVALVNRMLKQRRRRRRTANGKEAIGVDLKNNNFARAAHSFVDFFAVTARLRCETA